MTVVSKQQADAHDRLMDAAADLSDLIAESGVSLSEQELEELCVFLARNAPTLRDILGRVPKSGPW